jgi:hypothetical protein
MEMQEMLDLLEDEDEELIILSSILGKRSRGSALTHERWRKEYLINLAVLENSFVTEYRMKLGSFRTLARILNLCL